MTPIRTFAILALALGVGCGKDPTGGPPEKQTGTFRAVVTTGGAGQRPSSLKLLFDDREPIMIPANGMQEIAELELGDHTARLEIPVQCIADHYAPRGMEIEVGEVTELQWSIRCPLPSAPGLTFDVRANGGFKAWSAATDGSQPAPLPITATPAHMTPVMNPARTRIAYVDAHTSVTGNYTKVHLMDHDGSNDVVLPWGTYLAVAWSPDGSRLAINEPSRIRVIWADGVLDQTIEAKAGNLGYGGVDWSPDGTRLTYKDGAYSFVHDLATGTRTNLLNINVSGRAVWSPDGTQLAWAREGKVWVGNADGSNAVPVVDATGEVQDWSSTGELVYTSWVSAGSGIFTVRASGGEVSRIFLPDGANNPRWAE